MVVRLLLRRPSVTSRSRMVVRPDVTDPCDTRPHDGAAPCTSQAPVRRAPPDGSASRSRDGARALPRPRKGSGPAAGGAEAAFPPVAAALAGPAVKEGERSRAGGTSRDRSLHCQAPAEGRATQVRPRLRCLPSLGHNPRNVLAATPPSTLRLRLSVLRALGVAGLRNIPHHAKASAHCGLSVPRTAASRIAQHVCRVPIVPGASGSAMGPRRKSGDTLQRSGPCAASPSDTPPPPPLSSPVLLSSALDGSL